MHNLPPIVGPLPLTPEWYEARYTGIFASEAAAACGLSDTLQPLDIYALKRRLIEPFEGNDYTRRGKKAEPLILDEYRERTGAELETGLAMCFCGDPALRFIGATPDARRKDNPQHLVEAKLCHWKRAASLGQEGSDEIFPDWLAQAQQQIAVMNADVCDVMVMLDPHSYRLFSCPRNERLIENLIEVETALWDRILRGDPPDPLFDKPGALDSVKRFFGISGQPITLSEAAIRDWMELDKIKEDIKAWEGRKAELQARVLHAIGEAPAGRFPNGTRELARTVVKDSIWTQTDVDVATKSLGRVKRAGHVRLTERLVKR
jgi:predicted phage-related endonuclease